MLRKGRQNENLVVHLMSYEKKEVIKMEYNNIKMLVTIVNRADGEKTAQMLADYDFFLQFSCDAEGTQGSEFLALLGLGTLEKHAVFSVAPGELTDRVLSDIQDELELEKAGQGIAFTVPLENEEGKEMAINADYSMLLTVVNPGSSEEVVKIAKDAGARGGTIIKAKQTTANDVVKFLGIAVQSEKEIVVIVTSKEKKKVIFDAINNGLGMQSNAQGIVLSVPVDGIAGMKV